MRLFNRPVFWVVLTVIVFAVMIGEKHSVDTDSHDESLHMRIAEENNDEIRLSDHGVVSARSGDKPIAVDNIEVFPSDDPGLDAKRHSDGDAEQSAPPPVEEDRRDEGQKQPSEGGSGNLSDGQKTEVARVIADEDGDRAAKADDDDNMDAVGGSSDAMELAGAEEGSAWGEPEEPIIVTHIVQRGENLTKIAAQYGIDTNTILAANDLPDANRLIVGQKLEVLTVPGAIHSVKRGESLWEISHVYNTDIESIAAANHIRDPRRIQPEQKLVIPGAEAASIANALRSQALLSSGGTLLRAFSWPVTGRISSPYGPRWGSFHHGIDIAVGTGTPVKAAANGRVSFSGWNGGYGYLVTIDHGDGIETRYAHNSRLVAKVGDYVTRGTVVAYSGSTGNSTGPHVHFEIRLRGQSYNPIQLLR